MFRVSGPQIKSTLLFATTGPALSSGRLLVHDRDDQVEYVVELVFNLILGGSATFVAGDFIVRGKPPRKP